MAHCWNHRTIVGCLLAVLLLAGVDLSRSIAIGCRAGSRPTRRNRSNCSKHRSGRCWSSIARNATARKSRKASCGSTPERLCLRVASMARWSKPGSPSESRLIKAIGYTDSELEMPPDGALPAEAVAVLTEWVRRGAAWPQTDGREFSVHGRNLRRWHSGRSTGLPSRSVPQALAGRARMPQKWVASPVDRFILARLEGARPRSLAAGRSADAARPGRLLI